MTDTKRIIDALVALTKALPGANAHLMVGIHGCTDDTLRAFVVEGARLETYEFGDPLQEWNAATLYVEGVSITAYGPHRPIVRPTTDPAAVEAALAQAAEALEPL
ncbi:MAG TPA: hypothetical protein VGL61_25740 [Kofleriaceae bacterium]